MTFTILTVVKVVPFKRAQISVTCVRRFSTCSHRPVENCLQRNCVKTDDVSALLRHHRQVACLSARPEIRFFFSRALATSALAVFSRYFYCLRTTVCQTALFMRPNVAGGLRKKFSSAQLCLILTLALMILRLYFIALPSGAFRYGTKMFPATLAHL